MLTASHEQLSERLRIVSLREFAVAAKEKESVSKYQVLEERENALMEGLRLVEAKTNDP